MKKIWILFLMFLVSISSYAFTLTCLGNYYSRISQMNVNIYQDLHNNRDGDFYIVTYENEGREYVRMVLGIKDLERLVKELDELKKNFPIYKKIVKDNGITDYHNKIGNAFPTKKKIQFFKDGTWHEDSSVNFALFINVTKDGFFYLTYKIPCSGVISRPAASTSCRSFFITSAGIHLRSTLTVRTRLRLRTMSIGA